MAAVTGCGPIGVLTVTGRRLTALAMAGRPLAGGLLAGRPR